MAMTDDTVLPETRTCGCCGARVPSAALDQHAEACEAEAAASERAYERRSRDL